MAPQFIINTYFICKTEVKLIQIFCFKTWRISQKKKVFGDIIISYGYQLYVSSNYMNINYPFTLFGSPLLAVVRSRRLIKIYLSSLFASLLISGILFNGVRRTKNLCAMGSKGLFEPLDNKLPAWGHPKYHAK